MPDTSPLLSLSLDVLINVTGQLNRPVQGAGIVYSTSSYFTVSQTIEGGTIEG